MSKFLVRMSALLLVANLACASMNVTEGELIEIDFVEESATAQEPTVWYKDKSNQRIAAAIGVATAAAYAVAVYKGKISSPTALLAGFVALFCAKKVENKEDKGANSQQATSEQQPSSEQTSTPTSTVQEPANNNQQEASFSTQAGELFSNVTAEAINMKNNALSFVKTSFASLKATYSSNKPMDKDHLLSN
jgi:hypothetical protein